MKSERKARIALIILSCLMAALTAAVTVVGSVTDVFSQTSDEKAVAVLILPQEDKQELEKCLDKLSPLVETGFDTEKMTAEDIFAYIRPYSRDGLYAAFGYETQALTDTADPAMRFSDENGSCCYYKISAAEIDSILSAIGLQANHALNISNCYYYDSYYYFASGEVTDGKTAGSASITDSRRIQDGRYYVTASFGSRKAYVIAGMQDGQWQIHSISDEPVFDSLGIKIQKEGEFSADYEMRSEVIEGKTEDGTVFRKYVVKYPWFFGESQGELQANAFYQSIITFYRQQAEQLESDYRKFVKNGGKTESLPIELHYIGSLSYADEENLCIINEITESLPLYEQQEASDGAAQIPVSLPAKTVECYTFEKETGLYADKKAFIGEDSDILQQLLYRLSSGYSCDSLFDATVSSAEIPGDIYGLGEKIYGSAGTLCESGYVFCYVNDMGIREDVVIPFDILEKLTAQAENQDNG